MKWVDVILDKANCERLHKEVDSDCSGKIECNEFEAWRRVEQAARDAPAQGEKAPLLSLSCCEIAFV